MRPCRECQLLNRQSSKTRQHLYLKLLGPEPKPGAKNFGTKPDENWQCSECGSVFVHTYSTISPFGWMLQKTDEEKD